jgi:methylisocitrate lyase
MLFTKKTPAEKRADFRKKLTSGQLVQMPGAHSPIVARIVEELGFDGIYISGGALSADLALPDIGLITLDELTMRGKQIARVTDLPALSDADTGFGEAMNAARTIREMEDAGIAACHLEDQELPKRCGHLDNKVLVDTKTMVQKIKAAASARRDPNFVIVARTDSKESEGLDAAIARCKAYVDAGADVIFPEAMHNEADFAAFRKEFKVPLLANLTEFGKTPLLTKSQLENLGYNIAIYPVTSLRLAMKNIEDGYAQIKRDGTNAGIVPNMQTRKRLYEVLHYEDYGAFDQDIYNFKL